MESSQPQRQAGANRQGLSFHFEMAVSWTPKNAEPPKNHRISFAAKKTRDETSTRTQVHRPGLTGEQRRRRVANSPALEGHGKPADRQGRPARQHQPDAPNAGTSSRRARSNPSPHRYRSAPSHTRAVPQGADEYGPMVSHRTSRTNAPEVWKALPPTPAPSTLTANHVPFMYPGREAAGANYGLGTRDGHRLEANITDAAYDLAPSVLNERPVGWIKEMESLATAMMTIDNGFEDQWWNQGTRVVNVGGELIPANVGTRDFSPGDDVAHTIRTRTKGVRVTTAVDEVSIESTYDNAGEPVSPVSHTSGPVLSYIYY